MELLWDRGRASITIRGAAHPDALAPMVNTQTVRQGLLPGWSLAPSVCSLSACAYVRLGSAWGGVGGGEETAKWKLSGCRRGVSGKCEWPRGRSVQMGDVTFAC